MIHQADGGREEWAESQEGHGVVGIPRTVSFLTSAPSASSPASVTASSSTAAASSAAAAPGAVLLLLVHLLWLGDLQLTLRTRQQQKHA
ncbi:hypothetical protein EYF80_044719 [Liparis tanakae]|uniref:Uncharacterized protein n=1 Tax=Liparis tanakae TaxID=230148 RepID=A0A4Z2FX11_9TELE|nr:hypothetical protein EYF80_044719 [Liparis tanakae]